MMEEKQFDLSIFKKTQELQKKYGIRYDPEKPVDTEGDLADRVYQAGLELFLDIGTYCTTTRRVIKVTEQELRSEIDACPGEVELGQGDDRVRMVHRDVEGDQEPVVIAGVQTAPFSDEEMMFKISKGCAMDPCIDGIWGGIVLKIEDKYDVIAAAPSEIYQYRKTAEILRKAIIAAGRPGMITINNAPTAPATIAMFDEEVGLRRSDYMEVTGMSEMKVAYDDLNRTAFALANGVSIHGSHSSEGVKKLEGISNNTLLAFGLIDLCLRRRKYLTRHLICINIIQYEEIGVKESKVTEGDPRLLRNASGELGGSISQVREERVSM